MPLCVERAEPGDSSATEPRPPAREVAITDHMIRLGQLLKLAGVVQGGGEAKALLSGSDASVRVNGEPESRRGRQLRPGDAVRVGETELVVVSVAAGGP